MQGRSSLAVVLLVGCCLALSVWSHLGGWHHGLEVLLCLQAIGWIAWVWLAHHPVAPLKPWLWFLPLLLPLTAVTAPPLLDDDLWRFLWDGWTLTQGLSPYNHLPADFFWTATSPA
jgi:hypothetical protein